MYVYGHRISIARLIINTFFIVISVLMVLPLLLVVSGSFTKESALLTHGFQFIPPEFSLNAYRVMFELPEVIFRAYGVTILVTLIGTFLSVFIISLTGYVISRRTYRYRRMTTILILITLLFSGGLIPSYILITQYLHLQDTIWALILPILFNPFLVLVMKGFINTIPEDLIDAAKMDGASEWRIYQSVILPLSRPALATVGVIVSFMYWNDWWLALLYIDDPRRTPLQLLLWRTLNRIEFIASNPDVQLMFDSIDLPSLSLRMAMVVLAAGPMMFVFPFFQRFFVKGITVGSLKS